MHQAADSAELCDERDDSLRNHSLGAIVSDLISLVGHVQASIDLIEAAIARETSGSSPDADHLIVLDDITPRYVNASCALNGCNASLASALRFLLDARSSGSHSVPLSAH
jgi:hypothetical protein